MPSDETAGFELVNGELEENPMSVQSNLLGGDIYGHLWIWARQVHGGDVFPQDSLFRCFPNDPGLFRKPDVAYVGPGRLSDEQYHEDGSCTVVPDLVVEVLSPNDLASRVNSKVDEWLDAGVRLVWVIDPDTKTVHEYTLAGPTRRYRRTDVLSGGAILPHFSLPLADLFSRTGLTKKS